MRHPPKQKSEYGAQLAEKQELRESYGLREVQFRRYFRRAKNPEEAIKFLEARLDNVVFRCGFAPGRKFARQLVSHGHIQVNGKNVNVPSYEMRVGDTVNIHPLSLKLVPFQNLGLTLQKYEPPIWIELDKAQFRGKIIGQPVVDDPLIIAQVRPIIEFYSR
ncbi:MAG: 30S ribosomal protein S4 [Candidatus Spechtbacteria bacterium]|nr:30S ribosomal protein S4 [Candidatus Spechtbacteria bacterium]